MQGTLSGGHSSPSGALSDGERVGDSNDTESSDFSAQTFSPVQDIFKSTRIGSNLSRFTPVQSLYIDAPRLDEAVVRLNEELDACQQKRIHGFSAAKLLALGAITDEELSPSTLSRRLFPAVDKPRWEKVVPANSTRGLYQLGKGRSGDWTAHNHIVWLALEPSLRLVSKFLENAHMFPWFDALFFGRRETIRNSRIQPGSNPDNRCLQSFHRRHNNEICMHFNRKEDLRTKILQFSDLIQFGITDGHANPLSGESFRPDLSNDFNGIAIAPAGSEPMMIYIAYQIIEPLLRRDLPTSVRLADQFNVALTILHEFCHSLGYFIRRETSLCSDVAMEPYFENDRLAELGYSFAIETFGFHLTGLVRSSSDSAYSSKPKLGFFLEKSPAVITRTSGALILDSNPWPTTTSYFPLPISWVWEIQQEKFWTYFVRAYGADALKPWPILEGRRRHLQTGIYESVAAFCDNHFWLSDTVRLTAEDVKHLNIRDFEAYLIAKERIRRKDVILQANPALKTAIQRVARARHAQPQRTPRPWVVRDMKILRQEVEVLKHILTVNEHVDAVEAFTKRDISADNTNIKLQTTLRERHAFLSKVLQSFAQSALSTSVHASALLLLTQISTNTLHLSFRPHAPPTPPPSPNSLQRRAAGLLTTAHALYLSDEHVSCARLCGLILSPSSSSKLSTATLAGAHMPLIDLCEPDQEKLYHAEEAVRLSRRAEAESPFPPESPARQHLVARRITCERVLKKYVAGEDDAEEVHAGLEECYVGVAREAKRLYASGDKRACARLCRLVLKGEFYTSVVTKSEMHFVMSRVVEDVGEAVRHAHHALALKREGRVESKNLRARLAEYRYEEEGKAETANGKPVGHARMVLQYVRCFMDAEPERAMRILTVLRGTERLSGLMKAEVEIFRGISEWYAGRRETGEKIAMKALALFQSLDETEHVRQRKKAVEELLDAFRGRISMKRSREDMEAKGDGEERLQKRQRGSIS